MLELRCSSVIKLSKRLSNIHVIASRYFAARYGINHLNAELFRISRSVRLNRARRSLPPSLFVVPSRVVSCRVPPRIRHRSIDDPVSVRVRNRVADYPGRGEGESGRRNGGGEEEKRRCGGRYVSVIARLSLDGAVGVNARMHIQNGAPHILMLTY